MGVCRRGGVCSRCRVGVCRRGGGYIGGVGVCM